MPMCDRCEGWAFASIGSMFNTDQICIECEGIEGAHPEFTRAVEVENAEVQKKNYNFAGIGLPADLREDAETRKVARR